MPISNRIAEQAVLNTENRLIGPALLEKQKRMQQMECITKDEMRQHAEAAAKRGAELFDARKPGWAADAPEDVAPDGAGMLFLSLAPEAIQEDNTLMREFAQAREGEQVFVSPLAKLDMQTRRIEELKLLMGLSNAPVQAMSENPKAEIDAGYYGLIPDYTVLGLGLPGEQYPVNVRDQRPGFCIDDATALLIAAWNAEIAKRKGK